MPLHQIKIYVASKLRHADKIKKLVLVADGFHLCSRWIDTGNLAMNSSKPVSHWQEENFDDIKSADYVLLYGEEGEHLKGALVEIGYALAYGKRVWVVCQAGRGGEDDVLFSHPDYEPWSHYSQLVRRAPSFEQAFDEIKQLIFKDERIRV